MDRAAADVEAEVEGVSVMDGNTTREKYSGKMLSGFCFWSQHLLVQSTKSQTARDKY